MCQPVVAQTVTSNDNRAANCGAPAIDEVYPGARRRPGASRRSAPPGLRPGRRLRAGKRGIYRRQFGLWPRLFVLNTPMGYRCQADDMHEKKLEHDITSLDSSSGERRLIEIRGCQARPDRGTDAEREACCGGSAGLLLAVRRDAMQAIKGTPNMLIGDRARLSWLDVRQVERYQLSVSALASVSSEGAQE